MKNRITFIVVVGICCSIIATGSVGGDNPTLSDNPLAKYAKKVDPDVFNPDVTPEMRKTITPVPGGAIRIRFPTDPDKLNPLTENDAQAQVIFSYIYDSLITRDPETFEWVPWMAKSWEIRDLVIMSDGKRLEGKILDETEEQVSFIEGAGFLTLGSFECTKIDPKSKTVVTKWGDTYKGTIKQYTYTVTIETISEKTPRTINKKDIADYTVELGDTTQVRRAAKKNVILYFHLRDGIQWHDGTPVTVEDIQFSLDTIRNEKVDCAPLRTYYRDIEGLEIVDNHTVKFTYKKPYFQALAFCGGITIIPKHIYEPDKFEGDPDGFADYFNEHERNRNPLGNGAYVFKEWEKGKRIIVEKNPDYWASKLGFPYWKKDQPYLDTITWIRIDNPLAAVKELQNGFIDADFDVEPSTWFTEDTNTDKFKQHFVRAKVITPLFTYIGWNQDRSWFKDKMVRRALTHLIPRERIANDIHNGLATTVTGPFFINGPVYDSSIEPYPYDPRMAKRLLRKAGWFDRDGDGIIDKDDVPFRFEYLIHGAREYHQKIADIVKENLEQAGIKVDIRKIDWTIFGPTVSDRKFDAVRFAWGTGLDGDPFQTWHSSQSTGRGSNYVGFSNTRADKLIEKGREEFDPEKRWAMFRELHHILHEEQPYTFMFMFDSVFFYNKKYRNVKLYPVGSGYNLTEWYIHPEK